MRLGPSPCIRSAICFTFSTMSVTSSRTPGIELNSCSTPSIWTADRSALQRGQQHAAQRVAQRQAEAALKRFGDQRSRARRIAARYRPPASSAGSVLASSSGSSLLAPSVGNRGLARSDARGNRGRPGVKRATAIRRSDAAALGRPAAVVRYRRHVADRRHGETHRLQGAQRGLTAGARTATSTSRVRMPCSCAFFGPLQPRPARRTASTCASP